MFGGNPVGKPADKKEIIVTLTELAGHRGVYEASYQCPPHILYYANLIMHWKCNFCDALRHKKPKKPKNAYIEGENVTIKYNYVNWNQSF